MVWAPAAASPHLRLRLQRRRQLLVLLLLPLLLVLHLRLRLRLRLLLLLLLFLLLLLPHHGGLQGERNQMQGQLLGECCFGTEAAGESGAAAPGLRQTSRGQGRRGSCQAPERLDALSPKHPTQW